MYLVRYNMSVHIVDMVQVYKRDRIYYSFNKAYNKSNIQRTSSMVGSVSKHYNKFSPFMQNF